MWPVTKSSTPINGEFTVQLNDTTKQKREEAPGTQRAKTVVAAIMASVVAISAFLFAKSESSQSEARKA